MGSAPSCTSTPIVVTLFICTSVFMILSSRVRAHPDPSDMHAHTPTRNFRAHNNKGTPKGGSRPGRESRTRSVFFFYNQPPRPLFPATATGRRHAHPPAAHPSNDPSRPQPPPCGRQLRNIHTAAAAYVPAAEAKRERHEQAYPREAVILSLSAAATEATTAWTQAACREGRQRHRRHRCRPHIP